MTLAQERAGIRAGIEAARASTLRRDLNSLETQRRQAQVLNTLERRGLLPAKKGRGSWDPNKPTMGGGGGGIASPLDEKTKEEGGLLVPDRPTYDEFSIPTSDGLFTFIVKPIQALKFTDANSFDSEFNLAPPSAPIPP